MTTAIPSIIVSGILIFSVIALFLLALVHLYNKKQHSFRIEKQLMQANFQKELLQTQIEIQEQTLLNISQEIHDNIGQVLSLAKLNLGTLPPVENNELANKLADTKTLVSKAIADLRDLSRSMHGDRIAEIGFKQSIEDELRLVQNTGQLQTQLNILGTSFKLPPQHEMILFRMLQEALNNCVKHAKATQVMVQLHYQPTAFTLTIEDDGKGFNTTDLSNTQKGIGLKSMHNRAALINGTSIITSSPDNGTKISFTIPQ